MPELPEVQTIVNDLKRQILGKKIIKIDILNKKIIVNSEKEFRSVLIGNSFTEITRVGKLMIYKLNKPDIYLLIHLRMTGQLIYKSGKKIFAGGHSINNNEIEVPNRLTHVIFYFNDRSALFYNDQRQFGRLQIVDGATLKKILSKYGIDPVSSQFTFTKFQELIKSKKMNIKAFLLSQSIIAGIGNIYADEILFRAKISPKRTTDSLTFEEIKKLYSAIKSELKSAIKYRGTTFNNYVDAEGKQGSYFKFLKVYKRENKKCFVCGAIIKKERIAGRSTRFCPKCQK